MADNASKTERRVTPRTLPPQPPAVVSTWSLLTIRTLALVGLCVAGYLAMLHYQAGARGTFASPLCTISSTINCNAVLGSVYARLFGVPIAAWAALTYVAILGASFPWIDRCRRLSVQLVFRLLSLHGGSLAIHS